jgi:hypothetical protein
LTFAEALDVLGVTLPCTARQAARAFRKRALETHPDRGGDPADFRRVTEALKIAHLGLADAMAGAGEVEFDAKGTISWRAVARRQTTTREVDDGTEVRVELTPEQTSQLYAMGVEAGGAALGQVLAEGARAFIGANPRKKRGPVRALPAPKPV